MILFSVISVLLFPIVFDLILITDWEMSRDNPLRKMTGCWVNAVHLKGRVVRRRGYFTFLPLTDYNKSFVRNFLTL
jgi:hypothetical protein